MSEKPTLSMFVLEISPPDPDAVKARLDVHAKSWARPDALEGREPVAEVEIAYNALNCIHYLQTNNSLLTARIAELEKALKPFARQAADMLAGGKADHVPDECVAMCCNRLWNDPKNRTYEDPQVTLFSYGDLRAARTTLEASGGE